MEPRKRNLTIKGLPEPLLQALRDAARERNRSLNQHAIECLRSGLIHMPTRASHEAKMRRLNAHLARQRRAGLSFDDIDFVALIRQGRDQHDAGD
jgi:hypothetical protein